MDIRLNTKRAIRALSLSIAALTLLHVAGQVLRWQFGSGFGLVRFFDVNAEGTVPTYFSALLMVAAAALLAFIALAEWEAPPYRRFTWALLAVVFLFLPYDELFAVHERLTGPIKRSLQT